MKTSTCYNRVLGEMDGMIIRKATTADYRNIAKMSISLFEGADYMDVFYFPLLHSGKWHPFLAEVDGHVIAVTAMYVISEDQSVYRMGARTALGAEGRGFLTAVADYAEQEIKRLYPSLKYIVNINIGSERYQQFLTSLLNNENVSVVQKWQYMMFDVDTAGIYRSMAHGEEPSHALHSTRQLQFREALSYAPFLRSFLTKTSHFISTSQYPLLPRAINARSIGDAILNNNVIISVKNPDDLTAVSLYNVRCHRSSTACTASFYGDVMTDLFDHVMIMVTRIKPVVKSSKLLVSLNIPDNLDCTAVQDQLSAWLGPMIKINKGNTDICLTRSNL